MSFKEGMERGRVEGELEDKSRVVLQGLIMRAAGLVSWMLCLCWSGWLQQMLQMKEVLLCVDIVMVFEKEKFPRSLILHNFQAFDTVFDSY